VTSPPAHTRPAARRAGALALGVAGHLASTTAFVYLLGFLADRGVPRTVNRGGPPAAPAAALAVDLALLALFAVPHSVLARPWAKRRMARLVPAAAQRSVYALGAALTLALLFWQWRPLPAPVWDVRGTPAGALLAALFWLGWALCAASVLATNLFDLTGLRPLWAAARGGAPPAPVPLATRWLYGVVRHPLYLGFLLALWAAPRLTAGQLLFALANSAYILVAVRYEERDLLAAHGPPYAAYQARVPRLVPRVPWLARRGPGGAAGG
jgi:protein-S-isoprenylcysteine O-methyltransferase Ste14